MTDFLDKVNIFTKNLDKFKIDEAPCIINTLNAYSYLLYETDTKFKKAILNSTWVLPDGHGIVLALYILKKTKVTKIAGADIFDYLVKIIHEKGGKCFFLGSTVDTLELIKNKLRNEYNKISVETYSPPYKSEFSEEDNILIVEKINKFNPDVLFVGMTAPKQEKWVEDNRYRIKARVICSIGAVFDFYAGTIKRPPIWMQMYGLEWLGRLIKEPRRMWKRYILGNVKFIWRIFILRMKL